MRQLGHAVAGGCIDLISIIRPVAEPCEPGACNPPDTIGFGGQLRVRYQMCANYVMLGFRRQIGDSPAVANHL